MGDPEENLIVYRLERVEEAVSNMDQKLDKHITIEQVVNEHSFKLDMLITSRNRTIAAMTTLAVLTVVMVIDRLFDSGVVQ